MLRQDPTLDALLVEDNPGDAKLVEHHLNNPEVERYVEGLSLTHVETLGEALSTLETDPFDVILLDLGLPKSDGIETLDRVVEGEFGIPIIVLTGLDDDRIAAEAIQHGAQDYLPKGELDTDQLVRAIRYAVERSAQERELQRKTEQMAFFNGILRHDMMNGMNVIRMRGELLADELDGDNREFAETIVEWSDDIVDLTRKVQATLAALTSEDEPTLEPVELAPVVESEISRARSMAGEVTFEADVPADVTVLADDLLGDVVGNLLTNAVQHIDGPASVAVSATTTGRTVRLTVADDGPGVPDAEKEAVLDRGEKGSGSTGSGFGLYFVASMVESYGGGIDVADSDRGGASFVVDLPVAE